MNADKATPRPWSINSWPQRDAEIRIGAAGTPLIATVHLRDTSINGQRDNAAMIVRAVNSFDAMREALAWALDQIEDDLDLDHQEAFAAARAALALADTDRR